MSRLSQTQTGAFFGILASALMLVLTAMALVSNDGTLVRRQSAQVEISHARSGLSLDAGQGSVSR